MIETTGTGRPGWHAEALSDLHELTERERVALALDNRATFCPHGSTVRLAAVAGVSGSWDVYISDLGRVGTWQRTEDGAEVFDLAGECVATVVAFAGTQVATVAGLGRQAAQWSDLAHKVLAGNCEIDGRTS